MNVLRKAFVASYVALLTACASGYSQFYTPTATPEVISQRRASPPPAEPLVERSEPGDWDAILDAYSQRGYGLIGYSSFNSGMNESESAAIKQGKEVGADLVLILNPQYTGTVSTHVPITTPTTSTSTTTGSATVFGPRGSATAFGSATTTTHGTSTTYIPMTITRSDYGALYFVKQKFRLGLLIRPLSNDERAKLESNKGVAVESVVDGSPAFLADILVGDIVLQIEGQEVLGEESFMALVEAHAGKLVTVQLNRNGRTIIKQVRLNT